MLTQELSFAFFPSFWKASELSGWGAHQAGYYNIVLQIYQGASTEPQNHFIPLSHAGTAVISMS